MRPIEVRPTTYQLQKQFPPRKHARYFPRNNSYSSAEIAHWLAYKWTYWLLLSKAMWKELYFVVLRYSQCAVRWKSFLAAALQSVVLGCEPLQQWYRQLLLRIRQGQPQNSTPILHREKRQLPDLGWNLPIGWTGCSRHIWLTVLQALKEVLPHLTQGNGMQCQRF